MKHEIGSMESHSLSFCCYRINPSYFHLLTLVDPALTSSSGPGMVFHGEKTVPRELSKSVETN